MSDNPLFSIIIPSHDGQYRIRTAIESCTKQSFKDYEIIVVCDSCEDQTEEIAKEYGCVTLKVKCRRDGLARNAGIDIAKGKYIMFLDDDDYWLHEYVFQQIAMVVNDTNPDLFDYSIIVRGMGYLAASQGSSTHMVAGHVWKRTFIGETRFNSDEYGSDVCFLKALTIKKPSAVWWDMPMYYYNYMREGSLSDRHRKGEI